MRHNQKSGVGSVSLCPGTKADLPGIGNAAAPHAAASVISSRTQQGLACQDARQPHAQNVASASYAKNDVHDALHFTEPFRIQVVRHLDVFVLLPGDLEGEACGSDLDKPQPAMASVGIVIMGFDVADTAVIVLKLTLNKKIGMIGLRQIKVIFAASLAIERDLEQLAAGLFDRYVVGVESQRGRPRFGAYPSSQTRTPIAN